MSANSGARDRILDALQRTIVDRGIASVTLEGVAAEAGVSKGGLLYHFRSKEALLNGLVKRLAEEADAELQQARSAPGGVVRFYLDTSVPSDEEAALYWSVMAALRTADGAHEEAAREVRDIFAKWAALIHEEVADPVLAETVRLVGDGLYLSAVTGIPLPPQNLIRKIFERLLGQIEQAAKDTEVAGRAKAEPRRKPAASPPKRE